MFEIVDWDVVLRGAHPPATREKRVAVLQTERLRLRALRHADAEELYPTLADPETMRYWSRGPFQSVEEVRGYLSWNVETDAARCWAIATRDDPAVARGWVILMDDNDQPGVLQVGYILAPAVRGRGYAREAVAAVVEHGLSTLGARRIWADIDPDNAASLNLLQRLGFEHEGYLRATWKTHIGIRDTVLMAKVRLPPVG